MNQQELLDSLVIGQSALTGRVFIGLTEKENPYVFKAKTDFTERLKSFAPRLFEQKEAMRDLEQMLEDMYAHADAADDVITKEWADRLSAIMERDA